MSGPAPAGYHTITPRIIVADPPALIQFLKEVFGAVGDLVRGAPAEMRIGDSMIMVSGGDGIRDLVSACLYLYVGDVDATFTRAVAAGATVVESPTQTHYGDRRAVLRDPWDNVWQIATAAAVAIPTDASGPQLQSLAAEHVPACAEILYGLPDWFGLEEANRAYVASLGELPGVVALRDGEVCGFLALAQHSDDSFEVHVMAVPVARHRQGIGQQLIGWADDWCRERGARWLHVKTRGPSTPDPGYERTRHFYLACGFDVLFESLELWSPEDAALILVKRLEPLDDSHV